MLWSERHTPKSTGEVVGNKAAIAALVSWARAWASGKRQPPIILHGPPGIGKSALPRALANDLGWDFLEMNASQLRNKDAVARMTGGATLTASLSGSLRLFLVDDIDSMFAADRGGLPELVRAIGQTRQPIILTAADIWNPKLAPLRKCCKGIALAPVEQAQIAALLRKITNAEHANIPEEIITNIAAAADGDVRSAINDLQAAAEGKATALPLYSRDRTRDARDTLKAIFTSKGFNDARKALFDADTDHDMLLKWMDENIPSRCPTKLALARAFDFLSRAALFDSRARMRQQYVLWRYSSDLMSGGVVAAGARAGEGRQSFTFPKQILLLSRTKVERARLGGILSRIASACHVSKKRAAAYLPLVSALSAEKESRAALKSAFDLTDDDLQFAAEFARRS